MRKHVNQRIQRRSAVASLEKKIAVRLMVERILRESKVAKIHNASHSYYRLNVISRENLEPVLPDCIIGLIDYSR